MKGHIIRKQTEEPFFSSGRCRAVVESTQELLACMQLDTARACAAGQDKPCPSRFLSLPMRRVNVTVTFEVRQCPLSASETPKQELLSG